MGLLSQHKYSMATAKIATAIKFEMGVDPAEVSDVLFNDLEFMREVTKCQKEEGCEWLDAIGGYSLTRFEDLTSRKPLTSAHRKFCELLLLSAFGAIVASGKGEGWQAVATIDGILSEI